MLGESRCLMRSAVDFDRVQGLAFTRWAQNPKNKQPGKELKKEVKGAGSSGTAKVKQEFIEKEVRPGSPCYETHCAHPNVHSIRPNDILKYHDAGHFT